MKIIGWMPQPGPQTALVECAHREIMFGGSRGGGKTDGVIGKWAIKERQYGSAFHGIMFRRTTAAAEDAIERSKQIYGPLGGKFNESRLRWRMPNGGRVLFRYLDSVDDAAQYQGQNVTDAWVEECGLYGDSTPIDRLFGVLRSAKGVPTQLILTGNPGGPGQHWIAQRYRLVPFPKHPIVVSRPLPNGAVHKAAVIPSRIYDNRILLDADPDYINNLHMVGSRRLVAAWLDGDWTAVEGAFLDGWDARYHVVDPFPIPTTWLRFRAADWGYARPFSVGWYAVVGDDMELEHTTLPRGCLVRYREWYGIKHNTLGEHEPNVGLRLDAEIVARGILDRDGEEGIDYGVLDPAAWGTQTGPSIAERMHRSGITWRQADNKRISQMGAIGGWDMLRARLRGEEPTEEGRCSGRPMIAFFRGCRHAIRTLPTLQHDRNHAEDLDTASEDHAADEVRYACMSRPWVLRRPLPPEDEVTPQPVPIRSWEPAARQGARI